MLGHLPLGLGPEARLPPAGQRIFPDHPPPVDPPPDVLLVQEDHPHGAGCPALALGASPGGFGGEGDLLSIEPMGDCAEAHPSGEPLEDVTNGPCLGGLDGEGHAEDEGLPHRIGSSGGIHHRHGAIAVDSPSGVQAPRKPPVEPPEGAIPEVVQIELVDDRLHRHHELGELVTRLDAVGHGDQLDPEPLEEAHQPEDLGGIAGQAREIVDQEHLEGRGAAQRGQQSTIGRAMLDADAREGFIDILVLAEHLPPLLRGVPPTRQELVVNRCRMLAIRAESRVDPAAHDASSVSHDPAAV